MKTAQSCEVTVLHFSSFLIQHTRTWRKDRPDIALHYDIADLHGMVA